MKLVRYGAAGKERPGLIDSQGRLRSLAGVVPDISGPNLAPQSLRKIRKINPAKLPLVRGNPRLGACVGGTRHFIAVGLNYADHAKEAGLPIPGEPILFEKAPSCIVGPNDNVMLPKGSTSTDWEVELAIVIGSRARYVPKSRALDVVAGFCVCNDVSERAFQHDRGGQWTKGKGCETFGPLGPWLVTTDEIPDVQKLSIWLDVNGTRMQNSSTANMVFDVATIVSYCSQFFIMEPGDVITTGTPPGVGYGMKPTPRYLKAGDVMAVGIEGLGQQRQKVVKFRP